MPEEAAPEAPQSVSEAVAQAQASGVYFEDAPVTEPDAEIEPAAAPAAGDADDPAAPEVPETPAAEAVEEPESVDPYADFGGVENMQRLLQIQKSLATEEGLRALSAQALYALGFDQAQVEAFLRGEQQVAPPAGPPQADADPFSELSDDDVVTVADARALAQRIAEEAAKKAVEPLVTQQEAARQEAATQTVDSTLIELLGEPPVEGDPERPAYLALAQQTLAYAQNVLPENEWNPTAIAQAVRQGHALAQAEMEKARKAYLATKKAAKQGQPKSLGDSPAPGGETAAEPKNVAEAIAAARAQAGYFG